MKIVCTFKIWQLSLDQLSCGLKQKNYLVRNQIAVILTIIVHQILIVMLVTSPLTLNPILLLRHLSCHPLTLCLHLLMEIWLMVSTAPLPMTCCKRSSLTSWLNFYSANLTHFSLETEMLHPYFPRFFRSYDFNDSNVNSLTEKVTWFDCLLCTIFTSPSRLLMKVRIIEFMFWLNWKSILKSYATKCAHLT